MGEADVVKARAALSFHLKALGHAGLIAAECDGRNLIYRACIARMNDLLGFLTARCCSAITTRRTRCAARTGAQRGSKRLSRTIPTIK